MKGVRIYAFPNTDRDLCYLRVPPTAGSACTRSFIDGAYPQVNAWHDALDLVDDNAVRVDVDGARALLDRNAFYSPLPRGAATPRNHRVRAQRRVARIRRAWLSARRDARAARLLGERPRAPQTHEDDVALPELELVRLVTCQLRVQALTVVPLELDARLEAEAHDAHDLRLAR